MPARTIPVAATPVSTVSAALDVTLHRVILHTMLAPLAMFSPALTTAVVLMLIPAVSSHLFALHWIYPKLMLYVASCHVMSSSVVATAGREAAAAV